MTYGRTRPLGIVLIAIFSVLSALFSLLVSGLSLFLVGLPGVSLLAHLLVAFFSVHAVFMLAAAYGLWTLQRWGRRLAFWLYVLAIPLGIAVIFPILPGSEFSTGNTVFQLFFVGIDIAILCYLSRLKIETLYEPD